MINTRIVDLNQFTATPDFLPETFTVLITIKSFDLQAIRQRYIQSVKTGKGTIGSVEKRASHTGGIAKIVIENGNIINDEIIIRCTEPRGIDTQQNRTAFSSENTVYVIEDNQVFTINNPWFSYIHTVKFSPFNSHHLLLSSSGLDIIFEIDYRSGNIVREWCAWENGFNVSFHKENNQNVLLTRRKDEHLKYTQENIPHLFIENPLTDFLPTAKRAAFINSVAYHPTDENKILATFFHEGTVREIDLSSGTSTILLDQMNSPHGGMFLDKDTIFATNTRGGSVVLKSSNRKTIFDFTQLSGKPDFLHDKEWIQNSTPLKDSIISIDSNRNQLVIFEPKTRKIHTIPYNDNWAVQDIVPAHQDIAFPEKLS